MNNNLFSICNPQNMSQNMSQNDEEDNKNQLYSCCINTCTQHSSQPQECWDFCGMIYPIVKNYCVFREQCWKEGFYDQDCIKKNSDKIYSCCKKDCMKFKTGKYSNSSLNCDEYCKSYNVGDNIITPSSTKNQNGIDGIR